MHKPLKVALLFGFLAMIAIGVLGWRGFVSTSWLHRLSSSDPAIVEAARQELMAGQEKHVNELRQIIARAGNDWDQEALALRVLEILRELGPAARSAAPEVTHLVVAGPSHIAEVAAQTLSAIEVPAAQAVTALRTQIQRTPNVPALRTLAEYGKDAEPATGELIEIMEKVDLPTEVRWNAARTLGKARSERAIDALVQRLTDTEDSVREHAAEALGDIGPPASHVAPALVDALDDPYVKVRRDAVRSLGQISPDPAQVIPAIEPLLKDPEEIVRDAAKVALERIQSPTKPEGT